MTGTGPTYPPIRKLAPETVERIAAGEVVERPASVVKELVENAVDAGATVVTVRIEGGGIDRIEVADDGIGIPPDELELAVERHATSKLAPEGPVEEIDTLGFRGEALAAIASVARLRLLSRPADREVGEGLSRVGGTAAGRFAAPRAPGTTVEVEDLFFNTPARRKFLKSPAAEQIDVTQTLERTYLARPKVTLRLEAEGHELAIYPATSELRDAATRVLGPEFLHGSFGVEGEVPGGRLYGVLGRPSLAVASSRGLYLAVNGRPIVSRPIQQSVRAAFGDYLPRTRFPVGVLHLELGLDRLDVNVHPTKREVRFLRERELAEAIRVRVREGLIGAPQVAEVAGTAPATGTLQPWRSSPLSAEAPFRPSATSFRVETAAVQRKLEGATPSSPGAEVPGIRGHPRLRLLGCLGTLYWAAEADDGLVLIDQHAASERVLFDLLLKDRPLSRQMLVEPATLRLTGAQRAALKVHAAAVAQSGFDVEPFGPETYRVRTVPSFRGRRARPEAAAELLDELAGGGRPTSPDGLAERTAATLACHAAIRAGDVVSTEEFSRVLEALYALPESAYACPHGRPILLGISRSKLDRWFLRSGP